MSDLDTHVRFLQTKNKVEAAESNARQEYDREHEAQERELGESDSVEGHHESLGVLDASASDLSDALTVHYHADIVPDTDKKVDDLVSIPPCRSHFPLQNNIIALLDSSFF